MAQNNHREAPDNVMNDPEDLSWSTAHLQATEQEKELDRKSYNLFILYHASRTLSSVLEVEELGKLSIDMVTEVMNSEWGLMYLLNEAQDHLELRSSRGLEEKQAPPFLAIGEGMVEWGKGRVEIIDYTTLRSDAPVWRALPELSKFGPLEPTLLIPIIHKSRFVGLIVLGRRIDRAEFTENDIELLSTIASLCGNAVVNAQLYELAIMDGNTKLFVVRYFRQRMIEELKRATRYNQPVTLVMLDIDHFKSINDKHGHPVGDVVLGEIGEIIRKCSREFVDIPCRYGGEEFAILLPETDLFGAYHVAERIRQTVNKTAFAKQGLHITVSAGLATYPADAMNPAELVEKADLALYESKRAGRDKVMAYNQATLALVQQQHRTSSP